MAQTRTLLTLPLSCIQPAMFPSRQTKACSCVLCWRQAIQYHHLFLSLDEVSFIHWKKKSLAKDITTSTLAMLMPVWASLHLSRSRSDSPLFLHDLTSLTPPFTIHIVPRPCNLASFLLLVLYSWLPHSKALGGSKEPPRHIFSLSPQWSGERSFPTWCLCSCWTMFWWHSCIFSRMELRMIFHL